MDKSKLKLLVIDDDEINEFIIKKQIQTANLPIEHISLSTVKTALAYLKENVSNFPDIIFVDIHMPDFDGFEFLEIYEKEFYSQYPSTKLFMVSSSLRNQDIEKTKKYNSVYDFMPKPITIDLLKKLTLNE